VADGGLQALVLGLQRAVVQAPAKKFPIGLMMSRTRLAQRREDVVRHRLHPEVRLWVRPLRSSEMMESESTTSTTTVSVRRDRRDLGHPGETGRSVSAWTW
jgi:hypothetical protein